MQRQLYRINGEVTVAAARDNRGRFKKGGPGGPGRLPRARELEYLDVTVSAVSLDDWKAIIHKAVDQARRGDSVARKFLADYVMGTPEQRAKIEMQGQVNVTVPAIELAIEKVYGNSSSNESNPNSV